MKTRELFEILIRVIGVWEFMVGLAILPHWVHAFSMPTTFAQFPISSIVTMLGSSGLKIVGGLVLFFGARWLANKTYPEPHAA